MIELLAGAILLASTLLWSATADRRRGRVQRSGGDVERYDQRMGSTAARLVPGLLMVLGVTLIVSGVTGT